MLHPKESRLEHMQLPLKHLLAASSIGQVERHQAFGRGAVRAARINELLEDSSWNWCGLATFYVFVTLMGFIAVYVLHWTNAIPDISISVRWILATLVPGGLTLLKMLLKVSIETLLCNAYQRWCHK